jgi:S-(hydroxymethyl)glutathione dehydrogenase/alcohol dehydrogenase
MNGKKFHVKALVLNAVGRRFELEEIDIANPTGREVLVDVQGSGLCHTDLLFATLRIRSGAGRARPRGGA